jgi:predicted ATPase
MIKRFILDNFKSHEHIDLNFKNLTVLCGPNAVGKSSIIQALLLIRESFLNKSEFKYLDLKSNTVNLGIIKDALFLNSQTNQINFEIETDKQTLRFHFDAKDSELTKTLIYKSLTLEHEYISELLPCENLFRKDCQFISAARLGPQISYKKNDVVVDVNNQISVINGQAEYCVHFLDRNKEKEVIPALLNGQTSLNGLLEQTTAWEREISEGVNVVVEDRGSLGYELLYQFNTESFAGKTDKFKASNVGFGLTYAMPIIVAILSSTPDNLIFIENPEAHLHPNGQAKLAELICLAAQAGIQIVIETHSDHFINGILVQCKKFEKSNKGISRKNVNIYNFKRDEVKHSSLAEEITINDGGRIVYTPPAFFDQFTIDRKYLLGF